MKAVLSSEVISKFPNLIIAFSTAKDVKVFGPNKETNKILTDIYPQVKEK